MLVLVGTGSFGLAAQVEHLQEFSQVGRVGGVFDDSQSGRPPQVRCRLAGV